MVPAKKSSSTRKTSGSTNQISHADAQPDQTVHTGAQGPASQERRPLVLPKGALIAMRTSQASSEAREVIVYPDGRVTFDAHEKPDMRRPRTLTDARIAEIRHTLERINFLRMTSEGKPPAEGEQTGNRVQFAARMGTRTNSVEYSKENLPASLAPLMEQLSALLPQGQSSQASDRP